MWFISVKGLTKQSGVNTKNGIGQGQGGSKVSKYDDIQ